MGGGGVTDLLVLFFILVILYRIEKIIDRVAREGGAEVIRQKRTFTAALTAAPYLQYLRSSIIRFRSSVLRLRH